MKKRMKYVIVGIIYITIVAGSITACGNERKEDIEYLQEIESQQSKVLEESISETVKESDNIEDDNNNNEFTDDGEEILSLEETEEQDDIYDSEITMSVKQPQFKYRGNLYTMGITTLQDIIDDGVAEDQEMFCELADKIIPAGSLSEEVTLNTTNDYYISVAVYNDSKDDKISNECTLGLVRILLDNHDEAEWEIDLGFPLYLNEEKVEDVLGKPSGIEDGNGTHVYEYHDESYADAVRGYNIAFLNRVNFAIILLYQ